MADPEEQATQYTWRLCCRIFRGGDPNIPGACFLKDKIYFEGNIKMWSELEKNPAQFEKVLLGKFDPTNKQHADHLNIILENSK